MKGVLMTLKQVRIMVLISLLVFILTVIYAISARAEEINLTWDAVSVKVDGYRLYKRIEGAQFDFSAPAWQGVETNCAIADLDPTTQYYFVVRAYLGTEESGDSNELAYRTGLPAPENLRLNIDISVNININGQPYIKAEKIEQPDVNF